MLKQILFISLPVIVLSFLGLQVMAQYTLDEIGFNAGIGAALYNFEGDWEQGIGVNANVFYSHYFCGKAYGFHTQGGFNYINSGTSGIHHSQIQFEGGFLIKFKKHSHHRSREWAVLAGPKFQVPLVTSTVYRIRNVGLSPDWIPVVPVVHASIQFRRPAPQKKSWFIQPGVEYGVLPDYKWNANEYRRIYFFLHFGYAFFDKRG